MNNLYQILDKLREFLLLNDFVNTVSFGEVSEIDLSKLTNFPLSHIYLGDVSIEENYLDFTINIIACDIVDVSKEESADKFLGNTNVQDVLSTQLKVITDVSNFFRRADLVDNGFIAISNTVTATPFLDKFPNEMAGWETTYTLRSVMQDKC